MTNPINWSPPVGTPAPAGLEAVANPARIGDTDPDVFGPDAPDPDMIFVGPRCPGDGPPKYLTAGFSLTNTTDSLSIVAGRMAALGVEFVVVQLGWQPAVYDTGYLACDSSTPGVASMDIDIEMGGTRLHYAQPLPRAYIPPEDNDPYTSILLHPGTPNTWPGQDPDNLYNQGYWQPSELVTMTYTISGTGGGFAMRSPGYGLYGYKRLAPPVACTILPPLPPPPTTVNPGTITFGDPDVGIVRRGSRR